MLELSTPERAFERLERVRAAVAPGDVYQVKLVQHLSAPFAGGAAGVVERLAPLRPRQPRALHGEGWTIISASASASELVT